MYFISKTDTYLYRNVELATQENCLSFCFARFGELSSTQYATVAPKSNLIRLLMGLAHEWSGVWIEPYYDN